MIFKTVELLKGHPECTLTVYACDEAENSGHAPRAAMIVCPGGGYRGLAAYEGEPIARKYLGEGLNVYLLKYSLKDDAKDFIPLIEAALAVKYVRENAAEHNTDPNKIFITGSSAGGHLAASCGVLWNIEPVRKALGIDKDPTLEGINKPNGMVLSYPVITGGVYRHANSFRMLTGKEDPTDEERDVFSIEKHIDETTPPAFIWHTVTDDVVPIQNALLFVSAMAEKGRQVEAHLYPFGPHGCALGTEETGNLKTNRVIPELSSWFELSITWIRAFNK